MISYAEIEKLRQMRTAGPSVLSLYLRVPLDPAEQRELRARAGNLMDGCDAPVPAHEREAVAALLAARGRQWLGNTVAIFGCEQLGLLTALTMRCPLPERAVLDTHPHIRPLLTAAQRWPAYQVLVADARCGWLMAVDGDEISVTHARELPAEPGRKSDGWYGLDSYRTRQRAAQRNHRHYQDAANLLLDPVRNGGPVVVGGHPEGIPQLLRLLPEQVHQRYAGSFTADLTTLTPVRARELADEVVAGWVRRNEERLAREVTGGPRVANGLAECVAAVNANAVGSLLVPDDGMVAGFECGRCGALSLTGDDCTDWGVAACRVPDLLEEMACRVLDDRGEVVTIAAAGFSVAARLRFDLGQAVR